MTIVYGAFYVPLGRALFLTGQTTPQGLHYYAVNSKGQVKHHYDSFNEAILAYFNEQAWKWRLVDNVPRET